MLAWPLGMGKRTVDFRPWLVALALVTACGGETEGGSHEPSAGGAAPKPGASTPDPGQSADTELGDCVLGALENRAIEQPCAWVADKRCYQTREMACNCACPRSRNSQCASGFDAGPDGHVWVTCN